MEGVAVRQRDGLDPRPSNCARALARADLDEAPDDIRSGERPAGAASEPRHLAHELEDRESTRASNTQRERGEEPQRHGTAEPRSSHRGMTGDPLPLRELRSSEDDPNWKAHPAAIPVGLLVLPRAIGLAVPVDQSDTGRWRELGAHVVVPPGHAGHHHDTRTRTPRHRLVRAAHRPRTRRCRSRRPAWRALLAASPDRFDGGGRAIPSPRCARRPRLTPISPRATAGTTSATGSAHGGASPWTGDGAPPRCFPPAVRRPRANLDPPR